MSYAKTVWETGDIVTANKLNNAENGIETANTDASNAQHGVTEISAAGAIGTTNIADGSVTSAKIAAGAVTDAQLSADLKSKSIVVNDLILNTLNNAVFGFGKNKYSYELGAIASANGLNTDSDKRIRTVGMFFCTAGTVISNTNNASNLYVMLYNMDGSYNTSSGGWVATYTIPTDSMVRITARKASDNPTIAENEISTLVSYIDISYKQMIPLDLSRGLTAYATDPFDANSLSVGMIAINNQTVLNNASNLPEKAFGLLFSIQTNVATRVYQVFLTNTLNQRIWIRFKSGATWFSWTRLNTSLDDSIALGAESFDWILGYTVIASGALSQSPKFACTQPRTVKQFDIITNNNNGLGSGNLSVVTMVAAYYGSTFVERVTLGYRENYIVPSGVDNVRFIFGYPSSVTTAPDMTSAQLRSYFSVLLYGDTARYFENTDGELPVYAAFGASTTIGAVHHKDGSITYSPNSYPEYIGQVLNLETHNLGVGSTGFLKRNGSNNNFCDQILNNATILSKAKVVTLMFGYGNDYNASLPIGSFDDFFPYDDDAYRSDDTAVMLARGATLFGLLNWCISYINEHYPYAQLILIFGSPATSDIRTITKTAQTGSAGVAPYKLSFADPYSSAAVGSVNYRIKEINTELEKLKSAMDIPVINLFFGGNCFSYYSTQAKDPNDNTSFALFSTTLDGGEPVFNRHPSDKGYLYFSRFIAGKIISEMKH